MRLFILGVVAAVNIAYSQDTLSPAAISIQNHIKFLASEQCEGRAPASQGIERAAAYIENWFRQYGVKPAGTNGTYRDTFTMTTGVTLGNRNSVWFDMLIEKPGVPIEMTKPIKVAWKPGADYQPYGFSESGKASGRVVFAGFGISTDSYDDYKGIDVKDAIVIVIRGLPKWAERDEKFRLQAALRTKATTAREKGAKVVCFVNVEGDSSDVLQRFGLDRLGKNSGIIALQVRRTPCARIFPPNSTTLYVAEKSINDKRKPMSFVIPNSTATVESSVDFIESTTSNIIGRIEGYDPAISHEYVVIGAHYDHLGMGDENSLFTSREPTIHPGADDNASGTAGVLELAKRFSSTPTRRSLVFMTFSGEEKGLIGSKRWTTTPTMPLNNAIAMINMDMIGRLTGNKLNVQGIGTSPQWKSIVDSVNSTRGFKISTTSDGFGPSDHSSFTAKKVPVLFFFTGLHSDYHRPSDTWDKINAEGESRILDFVEQTIRYVADDPTRLLFAEGASTPSVGQSSSIALKVTFGIVPDYSDDPQGLRISGVRPNTPASRAGLIADDIITRVGKTIIRNIYDLMAALGTFAPGDATEVVVLRDDKPVTMKVTFVGK